MVRIAVTIMMVLVTLNVTLQPRLGALLGAPAFAEPTATAGAPVWPSASPDGTAAATSWVGLTAFVAVQEVNIRRSPGYLHKPANDIVGVAFQGEGLRIVAGPQQADGLTWWYADSPRSVDGWVAERDRNGRTLLLLDAPRQAVGVSNGFTYRVERGDTLGWLANRFGLSVQSLMAANGLSSSRIELGQLLWIPAEGIQAPTEDRVVGEVVAVDIATGRVQLVSSGQVWIALVGPAVPVDAAVRGPAAATALRPGQTVEITGRVRAEGAIEASRVFVVEDAADYALPAATPVPAWPAPGLAVPQGGTDSGSWYPGVSSYQVVPGDTLSTIARRTGRSVEALRQANGLAPWQDRIYAYQWLIIP